MNLYKNILNISIIVAILALAAVVSSFRTVDDNILGKRQDSQGLYETMVKMDSIYFTAYNNCDMVTQELIFADDIEFYHDKGGLSTNKQEILESIKKNICGKVTRELVPNSMEVYPIAGYGAVMMGMHKFHNNQEPDAFSKPSKFIGIWKKEDDNWKMTRVISLH